MIVGIETYTDRNVDARDDDWLHAIYSATPISKGRYRK